MEKRKLFLIKIYYLKSSIDEMTTPTSKVFLYFFWATNFLVLQLAWWKSITPDFASKLYIHERSMEISTWRPHHILSLWDVSDDGPAVFVCTMYCGWIVKHNYSKEKGRTREKIDRSFLMVFQQSWKKIIERNRWQFLRECTHVGEASTQKTGTGRDATQSSSRMSTACNFSERNSWSLWMDRYLKPPPVFASSDMEPHYMTSLQGLVEQAHVCQVTVTATALCMSPLFIAGPHYVWSK